MAVLGGAEAILEYDIGAGGPVGLCVMATDAVDGGGADDVVVGAVLVTVDVDCGDKEVEGVIVCGAVLDVVVFLLEALDEVVVLWLIFVAVLDAFVLDVFVCGATDVVVGDGVTVVALKLASLVLEVLTFCKLEMTG